MHICHNACATSQRGRMDGLGPQQCWRELVTRVIIAPAPPPLNLRIPTPQRGPRASRTGLARRPLAEGASGSTDVPGAGLQFRFGFCAPGGTAGPTNRGAERARFAPGAASGLWRGWAQWSRWRLPFILLWARANSFGSWPPRSVASAVDLGGRLDIKAFLWMGPAVSACAYQAALVLMGAFACPRGSPCRSLHASFHIKIAIMIICLRRRLRLS